MVRGSPRKISKGKKEVDEAVPICEIEKELQSLKSKTSQRFTKDQIKKTQVGQWVVTSQSKGQG